MKLLPGDILDYVSENSVRVGLKRDPLSFDGKLEELVS